MRHQSFVLLPVLVALGLLASCTPMVSEEQRAADAAAAAAGQELDRQYQQLAAAGGKLFRIDPAASAVRIHAFRAGRAARFGHNHVLSAPDFRGYFLLPAGGPAAARFDLEFRLDKLEIDIPEHRLPLGPAFSSALTAVDIEGTRDHMLGEDNLQADRYPVVTVHSLAVSGEAPKYAVKVAVGMHGQTREMWVPLTVRGLPERLEVEGSFVIRQTDFGAKPYSVMGGMLSVQDEVIVEFRLKGA